MDVTVAVLGQRLELRRRVTTQTHGKTPDTPRVGQRTGQLVQREGATPLDQEYGSEDGHIQTPPGEAAGISPALHPGATAAPKL